MLYDKLSLKIVMSLLVVSLISTSFGGAFATAALAADLEDSAPQVENAPSTNAVIGGLLAVGLIAAIASGGKSHSSSDAAKSQTTGSTGSSSGSSSSGSTSSGSSSSSGSIASDQALAVQLMNADRAANGLPALKVNSSLTSLAGDYAQDMINRNYFSHYNPEGQSPFDRMQARGITYKTAGENLAINTSVAAAEKAFMNSSGHKANILNSTYTEVGIGVRYASNGSVYVVQEFTGN